MSQQALAPERESLNASGGSHQCAQQLPFGQILAFKLLEPSIEMLILAFGSCVMLILVMLVGL